MLEMLNGQIQIAEGMGHKSEDVERIRLSWPDGKDTLAQHFGLFGLTRIPMIAGPLQGLRYTQGRWLDRGIGFASHGANR
ncbi:hypothetical protein ACLBXM_09175 [Xanthobacteraceae bacterium A53D]